MIQMNLKHLEDISKELEITFGNEDINKDIARLYSQHIKVKNNEKLKSWNEKEAIARLADAELLLTSALLLYEHNIGDYKVYFRKAGEIFEWLQNINIPNKELPINFLSASAYHLAGYPARAQGVLKHWYINEHQSKTLHSLLQNDYLNMQYYIIAGIHQLESQTKNLQEPSEKYSYDLIKETLRCLGVYGAWLRWGNESRIESILEKVNNISKAMLHSNNPHQWLLSKIIFLVVEQSKKISLRNHLTPFYDLIDEKHQNIIEQYLQYSFQNKKALTWPSQIQGIENIINDKSFALCTPTGSGKTRIAEIAIIHSILKKNNTSNPIVLYLVPTRALAREVEHTFNNVFRKLITNLHITTMYGGNDWGSSDTLLNLEIPNIIISTQEKGEALLRFLGTKFYTQLSCLIIDEAHNISDEKSDIHDEIINSKNRAFRLEVFVSKLMSLIDRNKTRVIALSAVASDMEDLLAEWVENKTNSKAITIKDRSTRQLIGRLNFQNNVDAKIIYEILDGNELTVKGSSYKNGPYVEEPFKTMPTVQSIENFYSNQNILIRGQVLWAAINFASKGKSGMYHPVLIAIMEHIDWYTKTFLKILDKDWAKNMLPDYFSLYDENKDYKETLKICEDYFSIHSREYRLLKYGIAIHHGKMPPGMANRMVKLLERGIINIVIATSTLSEGINIPVEKVILPGLRRGNRRITEKEFLNIAGRAGRPGFSTEGHTLILDNSTTQRDYEEIKRKIIKQKLPEIIEPPSSINILLNTVWNAWKNISNDSNLDEFYNWLETVIPFENNKTEENENLKALDSLDGFLLSSIHEFENQEDTTTALEDYLKLLWQNTFANFVNKNNEIFSNIIQTRGRAIVESIYPQKDKRREIYLTGLVPREAILLLNQVDDFYNLLKKGKEYIKWKAEERFSFITEIIAKIQSIPTFEFERETIGNSNTTWQDCLKWWFKDYPSLLNPNPGSEGTWYKYGATNFNYLTNWGLGSILGSIIAKKSDKTEFIDQWEDIELPWSIFWIKDLITWGILDPVAAYLLIEKKALTRKEAMEKAKEYWAKTPHDQLDDSMYNPMMIKDWFEPPPDPFDNLDDDFISTIPVNLTYSIDEGYKEKMNVIPFAAKDKIIWFDPAGYELATSDKPDYWEKIYKKSYDYTLEVENGVVQFPLTII